MDAALAPLSPFPPPHRPDIKATGEAKGKAKGKARGLPTRRDMGYAHTHRLLFLAYPAPGVIQLAVDYISQSVVEHYSHACARRGYTLTLCFGLPRRIGG